MPVDTPDYRLSEPTMHSSRRGFFQRVFKPEWEVFFDECVEKIFQTGGLVVDIGGGLRIDSKRGNRLNESTLRKFGKYLTDAKVQYKVTDYTDQYKPDFVEDIHKLSFEDSSLDAIFCIAVLEHVYDPKKATEELLRVLRPGGLGLIYVPFIYRYHAHASDYRDYFRYSKDGICYLFREATSLMLCPVRGLFESLLVFLPLGRSRPLSGLARALDEAIPALKRIGTRQTSGYFVFLRK